MNELALFAGVGGGILGGKLLGWRTVCAVEWEAYPASILCARQNDGLLAPFPIWDDVQTFDGTKWRGIVDVISGGFPCQDISVAGNGDGLEGERSGMWREMARIIGEVRPRFTFVENSPMLVNRGLERILADLTAMGYDSRWGTISAADIGANHKRDRIWIVSKFMGNSDSAWELQSKGNQQKKWRWIGNASKEFPYANYARLQRAKRCRQTGTEGQSIGYATQRSWWQFEPNVGRVANGVSARVDRLKAIGNAQVPLCAATAWKILSEMH
jgi:DNA (cytosine-5)-methyltransferase 1